MSSLGLSMHDIKCAPEVVTFESTTHNTGNTESPICPYPPLVPDTAPLIASSLPCPAGEWCRCTTVYTSMCLLVDTWVVSKLWLFWVKWIYAVLSWKHMTQDERDWARY